MYICNHINYQNNTMITNKKNILALFSAISMFMLGSCCNQTNNPQEELINSSIYSSLPFQMEQVHYYYRGLCPACKQLNEEQAN